MLFEKATDQSEIGSVAVAVDVCNDSTAGCRKSEARCLACSPEPSAIAPED